MQMIIGVLTLDVYIQSATSLKEKRMVIKSLKDKIRHNFNVSIAEVDFQDKWQRAKFGIVQVGNNYNYVQNNINTIFNIFDSNISLRILEHHFEFI